MVSKSALSYELKGDLAVCFLLMEFTALTNEKIDQAEFSIIIIWNTLYRPGIEEN